MDEIEFEIEALPSRRFMKFDLVVVGLNFMYQASMAVANTFESLADLAGMHANYQVDQRAFAEQVAHDIESITSEGD